MEGKILVCGGTGFIGRGLVDDLKESTVRVLVHKTIPADLKSRGDRLEFVQGNILDRESLDGALNGVGAVLNLVGGSSGNIYSLNILSTYNLLEACRERDIQKMLFVSSVAVYGDCFEKPALETDPPRPPGEYAMTKFLAESLCRHYAGVYGIPVTVLRLSNVYGPGQRTGVIFNFLKAIISGQSVNVNSDGEQRREFVYITDAVRGIRKALDYKSAEKFDIFNISGGGPTSLLELLSMMERLVKGKARVKYKKIDRPEARCLWSSQEKAKRLLGYEPETGLEQGLGIMLEHMQRNGGKAES